MSVNDDSVLRSVYYKYVHPKEVFIAEGILVPDVARKKNTVTLGGVRKNSANKINIKSSQIENLPFVYPYGASLDVQVRTSYTCSALITSSLLFALFLFPPLSYIHPFVIPSHLLFPPYSSLYSSRPIPFHLLFSPLLHSTHTQRPARPLLSSGPVSYPMNRPIAAIWESETVPSSSARPAGQTGTVCGVVWCGIVLCSVEERSVISL